MRSSDSVDEEEHSGDRNDSKMRGCSSITTDVSLSVHAKDYAPSQLPVPWPTEGPSAVALPGDGGSKDPKIVPSDVGSRAESADCERGPSNACQQGIGPDRESMGGTGVSAAVAGAWCPPAHVGCELPSPHGVDAVHEKEDCGVEGQHRSKEEKEASTLVSEEKDLAVTTSGGQKQVLRRGGETDQAVATRGDSALGDSGMSQGVRNEWLRDNRCPGDSNTKRSSVERWPGVREASMDSSENDESDSVDTEIVMGQDLEDGQRVGAHHLPQHQVFS